MVVSVLIVLPNFLALMTSGQCLNVFHSLMGKRDEEDLEEVMGKEFEEGSVFIGWD